MTYGTRKYKNGKERGYLTFRSGKKVVLKGSELAEFRTKLNFIEWTGREKEKSGK